MRYVLSVLSVLILLASQASSDVGTCYPPNACESGGASFASGTEWDGAETAFAVASLKCPSPFGSPCFTTIQEAADHLETDAPTGLKVLLVSIGEYVENVSLDTGSGGDYIVSGIPSVATWRETITSGLPVPGLRGTSGSSGNTLDLNGDGTFQIVGLNIYRGPDAGDVALDIGNGGVTYVKDSYIYCDDGDESVYAACRLDDDSLVYIHDRSGSTYFYNSELAGFFSDDADDGATGELVVMDDASNAVTFDRTLLLLSCDNFLAGTCGNGDDDVSVFRFGTSANAQTQIILQSTTRVTIGGFGIAAGDGGALLESPDDEGRLRLLDGTQIRMQDNAVLLNISGSSSGTDLEFEGLPVLDFDGASVGTPGNITLTGVFSAFGPAAPDSALCVDATSGSTYHQNDDTAGSQLHVCEGTTAGWVGK